jgi:hypothetical protein
LDGRCGCCRINLSELISARSGFEDETLNSEIVVVLSQVNGSPVFPAS